MKAQKSLLALAIAMSLGLSGAALAQQGGDGDPNVNADNTSNANNGYSGNADSGNDNSDNSDNSTNDSGNDNSDNSTNTADSNNDNSTTDDDDNSDNSTNDSGNSLELTVFLNNAQLEGSVSGNTTTYGDASADGSYTTVSHHNEISGGSANFTGVGAFAQNNGTGAVTQANVSVMSNLTAGGGAADGTR